MVAGSDGPTDWEQLLSETQRNDFVGRRDELDRIRAFYNDATARLLHIYGPAGMGKSALLREARAGLRERGVQTAWLDASYVGPDRERLERSLDEALSHHESGLLFIDEFHALEPCFPWMRRDLLPSLPGDVRLVSASRRPLPTDWETAPGWNRLLDSLKLGGLSEQTCRIYMERCAIPEDRRDELLAFAAGHPLTLAVATSALRNDPDLELGAEAELEALQPLLSDLLADVSTKQQGDALALAALVRRVRDDLLAHVLGVDDPSDIMRWLGRQPFLQVDEHGLHPHPLVRRLLLDDLQRYALRRVERLEHRAQNFYAAHVFHGDRRRARTLMFDSQYLARIHDGPKGWDIVEQKRTTSTADDRTAVSCQKLVQSFENERAADLFDDWRERQPNGLRVLLDPNDAVEGFAFFVDANVEDDGMRSRDPVFDAFCNYLDDHPIGDDERALLCRFWGGTETYQQAAPIRTDLFAEMSAELALPPVSVGCSTHLDAEHWKNRDDNILTEFGEAEIDDCTYLNLGFDWRETSRETWFRNKIRLLTGRLDDEGVGGTAATLRNPGAAVRHALKHFHRGDKLSENPLANSQLVRKRCDDPARPEAREAALRSLLEDAISSLGTGGDDAMHVDILENTYLDPDQPKQLAVASDMEMAYSTFRKHLGEATERVAERVRQWLG